MQDPRGLPGAGAGELGLELLGLPLHRFGLLQEHFEVGQVQVFEDLLGNDAPFDINVLERQNISLPSAFSYFSICPDSR